MEDISMKVFISSALIRVPLVCLAKLMRERERERERERDREQANLNY